MKRIARIPKKLLDTNHQKILNFWFNKITFPRILLFWLCIVFVFGLMYHFMRNGESFLYNNFIDTEVTNLKDAIYFSFVTATTTGFGDIVPIGFFKVIAIFEVVIDLLMVALVTSKFISIKQDIILDEMYEISFFEQVNRMRSSLLLFRQNLGVLMADADDGSIRPSQVNEVEVYLNSMSDTVLDITMLIDKPEGSHFVKRIEALDLEILLNSINQSLEKLDELIMLFREKRIKWKSEKNVLAVRNIMKTVEKLHAAMRRSPDIPNHAVKGFTIHYQRIKDVIEKRI